MNYGIFASVAIVFGLAAFPAAGQTPVMINVPGVETPPAKLSAADDALIKKSGLPKVRRKLVSDICEESFEPAGVVHGSFSKPNSDQRLVFYQFCQTGNGLGQVGLILIENGKIIGNYVADVGWTVGVTSLPDINQNGLNEVALYYSGGMHQGAGGTGVDIVELSPAGVKGIGWFQAEGFTETGPTVGYRVTAKPGGTPLFFREKYTQASNGKWKRTGRVTPFHLQAAISKFVAVK
jgi:hypothetical protein